MNRMEQYGGSELHFSLMALTRDRIELLQEQIEEMDGLLLSLPEDAQGERTRLNEQRGDLEHKLQLEKDKRKRWHVSCADTDQVDEGKKGLMYSSVERESIEKT